MEIDLSVIDGTGGRPPLTANVQVVLVDGITSHLDQSKQHKGGIVIEGKGVWLSRAPEREACP